MSIPDQSKSNAEHRAHPRVPTTIPAKISIPGEPAIMNCLVSDLSAGGAGLQYEGMPPRSEMVCLLSITGFGSFEGITTRDAGAVLGVRFLFGEAERCHLQENLIAFVKDGLSGVSELSKQARGPERLLLSFSRSNGERHQCGVTSISLQGVMLLTSARPPVGELIKLARMYGRVMCHDENGIGVQFVNFVHETDAAALHPDALTA